MSSPISSPGASPRGSSWELCPSGTEETSPSTSCAVNQQVSTIARCHSSKDLAEQNPSTEPPFLNWPPSPGSLADGVVGLFEAGGVDHNFTPAEAQEFADTMRAIQKPTGHKITRNREEGTSTIEFRPRHGLVDIHCLGLFFEQKLGFAGCVVSVEQKAPFNGKEFCYSSINLRNYQDLVRQRYEQIWEDRDPGNTEEYKVPVIRYGNSTIWPEKKKTVEQLEKELSYQDRFLQRAINIMNGQRKESDKVRPFDPAFKRTFIPTEKERITNKIPLLSIAGMTSIFFEYKTKTVPLDQERVCIAEIDAMPAYTPDEVEEVIKADLREHPIEVVDLHQISHLLEELGGYAASSALIEREYTLDGEECRCTAIILRNRQDLVDERYQNLRKKYGGQYDLPIQAPKCKYSVPWRVKEKTSQEAQEQLSSQAQLLQRAVQEMYVQGRPFDPLFERIYIPTDQERLDNFASISNVAQTDMILFVYRTSEDRQPKYAVEDICESIRTMAEVEGRKVPVEEKINIARKIGQVCLPLIEGAARYASGNHFFTWPGK